MKEAKTLKITLIISLLLHLLVILFFKNIDLPTKNDDKKIKLTFKRGGDTAIKDSDFKENTSIVSKNILNELQNNTRSIPNLSSKDSAKNIRDSTKKLDNVPKVSSVANSIQSGLDLSSLNLQNTPLPSQKQKLSKEELHKVMLSINALPKDRQNEIMELYGDELGDYGLAEIDFIINNLRDIGRINQYHINRRGYPLEAAYLRQSGTNIVEFYLYPNGDISDLTMIKHSKSISLDKNTLTTVQIAFKEYPRPTTKTKIRWSMKYYIVY